MVIFEMNKFIFKTETMLLIYSEIRLYSKFIQRTYPFWNWNDRKTM